MKYYNVYARSELGHVTCKDFTYMKNAMKEVKKFKDAIKNGHWKGEVSLARYVRDEWGTVRNFEKIEIDEEVPTNSVC